jgi:hypothetical protein
MRYLIPGKQSVNSAVVSTPGRHDSLEMVLATLAEAGITPTVKRG